MDNVTGRQSFSGAEAAESTGRRSVAAQQMLTMFESATSAIVHLPSSLGGVASGIDILKPHGIFAGTLIGGMWPTESESELAAIGNRLTELGHEHGTAAESASARSDDVLNGAWTHGSGADSAAQHYHDEYVLHCHLSQALHEGGAGFGRLSDNVRGIKSKMRDANDAAHREIEEKLRTNAGEPVIFSDVLAKYRTLIQQYSTELTGFVSDEIKSFDNTIPLPQSPGDSRGDGRGDDRHSAPPNADRPPIDDPEHQASQAASRHGPEPDDAVVSSGEATPPNLDAFPIAVRHSPAPGSTGVGKQSIPSLPSLPSTGVAGTSPLSGTGCGLGPLSGLVSAPGSSATGLSQSLTSTSNPAALQQQASKALSSALAENFGKGLAAGAQAVGGIPAMPQQPTPQTPPGPLGVPLGSGSTPASAAPASAPTPLLAPGSSALAGGTPAVAGGGAPASSLTPYGSVLPPAVPAAASGGSVGASLPPPSVAPSSGTTGGAATGFVPAVADPPRRRVSREVSMSDLESARAAVADLAAATCVGYPVLQWAVAVARGTSGLPEMWVATNEGASYIPQDVYLPRAMVLAGGHDPAFDARWFGWSNPAETVVRAIQARGDVVSAVATTWPQGSDLVTDATPDVAVGVPPSGNPLEAQSANLTRNRSHRLETIEPALFHDLERGEAPALSAYLRHVIQRVTFEVGPELSGVAQSVARGLISPRWPSADEWAALRNEYDAQRLMASSQRPGLIGVEEPGQLVAYQGEFEHCRRLEALTCCEGGSTADIVYAGAVAGVLIAFNSVTA